jgi:hypothetical protein
MLLRVVAVQIIPGLIFTDASKKEDKAQLKPAIGEPRGLGDGFSGT